MAIVRCESCPAERAYEAQKKACDVLAYVMFMLPRNQAKDMLVSVASRYGREYAGLLRADLNSRREHANRGA